MTLAQTHGVVIHGVDGLIVTVEAYLSQGLPGMNIVGLPDTAVAEARDRVRAAVLNSECRWPSERRITIGLSPASVHKRGATLDLSIALAILTAQGDLPLREPYVAIGELALDGGVRPVRGVLVAAITAYRAGIRTLVVPHTQVQEARLVDGLQVIGVSSLADAVAWSQGEQFDCEIPTEKAFEPQATPNLSDIRGQVLARQALEVAAAGGHHVGLLGSPGVGKTMLAERLPGLLPQLSDELALEVTAIHSVAGLLKAGQGLVRTPPFQAPHHSVTMAALVGGGSHFARVGLITLAHGGVLCLDEAAEFDRALLDALRQPLEAGRLTIARAGFHTVLPAQFQLVLSSNPCPCGKFIGTGLECTCSTTVRRRYFSRLSGPFLDRIDLRVTLEKPTLVELAASDAEDSATVANRVQQARNRAGTRFKSFPWELNAQVPGPEIRKHFPITPQASDLLNRDSVGLSLRGIDRVVRVAWTIADLQGHDKPDVADVAMALMFRDGNGAWRV